MITNDPVSYRTILGVAFPIMLSLIAANIVTVTDTAYLARLGEAELGAGAIGGLVYMLTAMLGFGFGMGAQILIARRFGEGRRLAIGPYFAHVLYIQIVLAIFTIAVLVFFPDAIAGLLVSTPNVRDAVAIYLKWRAPGLAFALIGFAFRFFYTGIGRTSVLTLSTAVLAVVNAVAAWGLIFGRWGLPRMGIAGAGLAAVIAEAGGLAVYVVHALARLDWREYALFRFMRPNRELTAKLVTLSLPMVFLYFVSLAGWLGFFVIIEKVGPKELALSNILRSIYMVMIIPVIPLQATTNSLVSRLIGMGRAYDIRLLIGKILALAVGITSALALAVNLFPVPAFLPFGATPEIIAESIPVLRVLGVALVLFTVGTVLFNAVSGSGDTKAAFVIETSAVSAYLIFVAVTALLLRQPLTVIWSAEWVYWTLLGGLAAWRLKSGRWRGITL